MTSFNLSEKIMRISKKYRDFDCIDIKDVKELIRLTEQDMRNSKLSRIGMVERFKKRVGDLSK